MSANVTVTGKVGPALTVTAGVFTGVTILSLDANSEILSMTLSDGRVLQIDVAAATTWTVTVSGNTYTVTIA